MLARCSDAAGDASTATTSRWVGRVADEALNRPLRVARLHRHANAVTRSAGRRCVMNPEDASARMLIDGELAWVYGPRRHELARCGSTPSTRAGEVVLRDIAGASTVGDRAGDQAGSRHTARRRRGASPDPPPSDLATQARKAARSRHHRRLTRATRPRGRHARRASARPDRSTSCRKWGRGEGLRYPRYGNSPNAEVVQRRMAALEGAEAAVLLASGMGATACALLALLRPGDHLLASSWIYGGTHALFTQEFAALGIDVTLVDPIETRAWRKRCARKRAPFSSRRR